MIKVSVSYGMVFDSFDDLKVVDYPHNFATFTPFLSSPTTVNHKGAMKHILLIPQRITEMFSRNQGRIFKITLLVLVFITGLSTRQYRGEHQLLINNNVGGVFYVLFGSLLISLILPRIKPYLPVLMAFGITCLLEVIQWFRYPFMVELTKNNTMAYVFGNCFNWTDFIYYAIGAVAGLMVLCLLPYNHSGESGITTTK
jgi:hypothetical protein